MEQLLLFLSESNSPYSVVVQFLVMVLVSLIPFAPIPVLAAYIGSQHDVVTGFIINMSGTLTGSILLYGFSKTFLQRLARKTLIKYNHLGRYLSLIETNGFLAVLIGRVVPILPSAGVNLIAGVSGVSLIAFSSATFIGKFPTIIAFSFAGNQLAANRWDIVLYIVLYVLILFIMGHQLKKKWRA